MTIELGSVVEGKVTRITNFGAFVELEGGKSGLVHISEVSDEYVNNVSDFLSEGDVVQAKVVNIDANGKIALSIKKLKLQQKAEAERERVPKSRPRDAMNADQTGKLQPHLKTNCLNS